MQGLLRHRLTVRAADDFDLVKFTFARSIEGE